MLIVDTREDKKILKYLEQENIDYKVEVLQVGDYYSKEKGFCVERKTITDLVGSYISKRIHEQLSNMQDNFSKYYLFISGQYNYFEFKSGHFKHITENSINKMKIHLLENYPELKIVEFSNDHQLVLGLKELLTYEPTSNLLKASIIKRKSKTAKEFNLQLLYQLPDIGEKKARDLLDKGLTVGLIFGLSVEELMKKSGLNERISRNILDIVNYII